MPELTSPIIIRRANANDLPILSQMGAELGRQHKRYDNLRFVPTEPLDKSFSDFYRNELDDDNAAIFVAQIEDKVAGYVFVRIEPDSFVSWFKETGWIHDIYVARRWRKTPVAYKLLHAGIEHLRALGSPGVMLAVAAKNGKARQFFKRSGFRVTMHEMRLDFVDPTTSVPSNVANSAPVPETDS
ncbi:GNAT family N-acetyltransferase [bacterium]|nr:GNAT family N-acetyltransferase [bacterium]